MREFVVMADSDSEIPYQYADAHELPVFLMPYTIDGQEALFDLGRATDFKSFYDKLRAGAEASTATRPPLDIQNFFEEQLAQGKDILYISFSSGLSAHYDLVQVAKKAALENYPDARIETVDSLGIAMGSGLLVCHAQKMKEQGASLDEIKEWVEQHKLNALHFFSVDSLKHLQRTGRLSAVLSVMGSLLDLKPILTVTKEGKVVSFDKVKGRKKVIRYLADLAEKNYDPEISAELAVVCHADNLEQAQALKEEMQKRMKFDEIWLLDIGPVIGVHAGPGALAMLMLGKERPL